MFEVARIDRPIWWRQIVDQFQGLRRDVSARAPDGIEIACGEEFDQLSLVITRPPETKPLLTLIARCEEEEGSTSLSLTVDSIEGSEELLRLVWYEGQAGRRRDRGRGLNTTADVREGPYAAGDAVTLLRERLTDFVTNLETPEEDGRALTVWEPAPPARQRKLPEAPSEGAKVIPLPLKPYEAGTKAPEPMLPPLVALSEAERAEFESAEGLYRDFTVACRGILQPKVVALYAQRILELMVTRHRTELKDGSAAAAAGMGMTGALKLFGVGVAFGVEIAAATFGFGAWMKAGWEGLVYALTGVGLIGGGLVPITSGRSRQVVMKVAVAWSLGVAALTAQNPKLIEPLQDQMRVFHRIDHEKELRLTRARSSLRADEDRKSHLEGDLRAAQTAYLATRRNADETRRDFKEGEKKREEAVKALQRQLEQQELVLMTDREEVERAEQAWQGAVLSDWTRYAAAGILFALSAIVGALGPIYLGLWLDERKKIYRESLAARRARHGRKTRTEALETNESTQRAEIGHIVASMRAYYADLLLRQTAPDPHREIERAFGGDNDAVEVAVRGFRRARGLQP